MLFMDRKTKGKKGEQLARLHYEKAGFEIASTNYRHGRAEIDFIAKMYDTLLVFVEVKMRSSEVFGTPETFVSDAQKERIMQAADQYIHEADWQRDIRFDIVCVDSRGQLEVFEDAF